jgi:hypothetical protein
MADINDGGPAFPRPETEKEYGHAGMTLRDYFAGQAIKGVQAAVVEAAKAGRVSDDLSSETAMAESSYRIADAMIAARRVRPR